MRMASVEVASGTTAEDQSSETSGDTSRSTQSLETEDGKETPVRSRLNPKETPVRSRLNLKKSFRTLSSPKKVEKTTKPIDKNEPSRFLGEGVSFKAKLIGILEVSEARGDRMCQEALADLKMAIRAAGEHKQRININIAIDGLRLRDEKTGDCLYHHPVHKISFIAQDMSDSRAFGYIFGSPDTGHRFFGIKTDKAASQVVIAMRDLFQVVFELKKREIEMAKQHIEQHQIKLGSGMFLDPGSNSKSSSSAEQTAVKMRTIQEDTIKENGNVSSSGKSAQQTSEVIADLLDLEFELNSIQQGIHQMERITPSDPFGPSAVKEDPFAADPFGDSFTPKAALQPPPKATKQQQSISFLPPPPSARDASPRSSDPFNVPPPSRHPTRRNVARLSVAENVPAPSPAKPEPTPAPPQEKHWFDQETESLFEEGELVTPPLPSSSTVPAQPPLVDQVGLELSKSPPTQQTNGQFDVFTELDPLGTGRSKPYIDRKDFFQELKNPPKKVLKDLVTEAPSEGNAPLFQATFDTSSRDSGAAPPTSDTSTTLSDTTGGLDVEPFTDMDPFDKTDPFADDDFSQLSSIPSLGRTADPFDTGFADFTMFGRDRKHELPLPESSNNTQEYDVKRKSPLLQSAASMFGQSTFHGPLRVSLPPEKASSEVYVPLPPLPTASRGSRATPSPSSTPTKPKGKAGRLHKQVTMVRLPSPKSSQRSANRLARQMTMDVCNSVPSPTTPPSSQSILESVTLRNRCAITPSPPMVACFPDVDQDSASHFSGSSAELSEIAPEPPPRPASNITAIKPPPLPPKRQQAGVVVKPPPRPPHSDDQPQYDYIENYETSSSPTPQDMEELKSPPIPVPARRPRGSEVDVGTAPQRPRRQQARNSDPPPFPLLPPPQKKSPAAESRVPPTTTIGSLLQAKSSVTTTQASEELKPKRPPAKSLNITLSELTNTGLDDLAATLGISPGQLCNMTLQDISKCFSQLSNAATSQEPKVEAESVNRDKYATLRESIDEEPMFKAEFENNFEISDTSEKLEDVFQETSFDKFDKYAVFRELMVQETCEEEPELESAISKNDEVESMEERKTPSPEVIPSVEDLISQKQSEDRYAALREIALEDRDETEATSDKEESVMEESKPDEDYDLLSLSHQPSEGTDSPTLEAGVSNRELTSIIESTIMEEDTSTLEADNEEILDEVEMLDKDKKSSPECVSESKEMPARDPPNGSTPSERDEAADSPPVGPSPKLDDTNSEGWAKFDGGQFAPDKPISEGPSEEEGSPWSLDGKEFNKGQPGSCQEPFDRERNFVRGTGRRPTAWKEDEESEEGWEERQGDESWPERPWKENGWSDGESFYEEAPPIKERMYHEERRGRRRRVSPWKGQRSSRDPSPWQQDGRMEDDEHWGGTKRWQDRAMDEEEEEEEYEVSWKTRPKHRGSSWDDERRRRYGSREFNGIDYEEGRKRRPSPWRGEGDRRGSWESASWDEEDRFSQRDYGERRMRGEEEYRRRWEPDLDNRSFLWARKCGPEAEYTRHEQLVRRKHEGRQRYYRDRSRESPWEEEYSEPTEEESPRYQARKRNWPKRPSSASEVRRGSEKPRTSEKQQHSLPNAVRTETGEKTGSYGYPEWRYRDRGSGRPRSREGFSNSDQEYWPHQERPTRRMDRDLSYEQRSQTLQTRRAHRYKKSQEWGYSQKSPFDDDFSTQSFEFSVDIKSQGGESDASDSAKKKSPISSGHSNNLSLSTTPTDTLSKRKDIMLSEFEAKPHDVVTSSPHDPRESPCLEEMGRARASHNSSHRQSPFEEEAGKARASHSSSRRQSPFEEEAGRARVSRSSSHRQSPFEDDFTPPDTRHTSARLASSVSSEVSEHPRSPYEDLRSGSRVESVLEETGCESESDHKNSKSYDDVFLPADNTSQSESKFADFENNMFGDNFGDATLNKPSKGSKRLDKRISAGLWSSEDCNKTERHPITMKFRMSSLKVDSPANLRKSDSVNIFARENDPFDDDFFSGDSPHPHQSRTRPDSAARAADKANSNNASDPFKWTKAFESFNFEEIDEEN